MAIGQKTIEGTTTTRGLRGALPSTVWGIAEDDIHPWSQDLPTGPPMHLGWNARVAEAAVSHLAVGREVGRLTRMDRGWDTVTFASGEIRLERAHAEFRAATMMPPAVGDWVAVQDGPGGPAIVALLDRAGVISRRDPTEKITEQVVAAGVDVALLCFPLDRPLRPGRFDRWLLITTEGDVTPVVVLTKADDVRFDEEVQAVLDAAARGIEVYRTSAVTGEGLEPLKERIARAGTAVLLGESGGGKSTLVNEFIGEDRQGVAEVRTRDRKGRHTTVARELFALPTGGVLIDTPGVRALGLWSAEDSLGLVFPEVQDAARRCKFSDCAHGDEPGCAVRAAIEAGTVRPERVDRYLALTAEVAATDQQLESQQRTAGKRQNAASRRRAAGRDDKRR